MIGKRRVVLAVSMLSLFFVFAATGSPAGAQTCVGAPSGLVGWWPGDGSADDIVGGSDGILWGGATYGPGMVGNAFQFDGATGFVSVASNPVLNLGTRPFTVAHWVKVDEFASEQVLVEKWVQVSPGDFSHGWSLSYRFDGLILSYGNGGSLPASCGGTCLKGDPQAEAGTWHHVAATRSGEVFNIYWDGMLLQTNTEAGVYDLDTPDVTTVKFGARGAEQAATEYYLNGMIDEVQIFSRELSGAEIQALYDAGSAGVCKPRMLTCQGFQPPLAQDSVTVQKNRVLPFKAVLLDGGVPVIGSDLVAPPVVSVMYQAGTGNPVDVTSYSLPEGQAVDGNQFAYDGTHWHFNFGTKPYTAVGTYTVSIATGDQFEYQIEPACSAQFVIR